MMQRREEDIMVRFGSFSIIIRNQKPLDPDCLELDSGWNLSLYIQALNSRVFFWPGTEIMPIEDGWRMAEQQKLTGSAVLRISTLTLIQSNSHLIPGFSLYNTGATWCNEEVKNKRGNLSFLLIENFDASVDNIVEVNFEGIVALPQETHFASSLQGPWSAI